MLKCRWYLGSSILGIVETARDGGAAALRRADVVQRVLIPADARARLRAIFAGDDARVDALIDTAVASLRTGAADLVDAVAREDRERVVHLAHGLKGIALEIGFRAIGEHGARLEKAAKKASWATVVTAHRAFADALRSETPSVFGLTEQSDTSRE